MVILALDLGTRTGFAHLDGDKRESGTWVLASDKERKADKLDRFDRTGDSRFYRLLELLNGFGVPNVVIFEDVEFSTYTYQTQLWSALRAAVWASFPRDIIRVAPVSGLKKYATGHGGATKEMMAAWLKKKYPDRFKAFVPESKRWLLQTSTGRPMDDNEIDANWLLEYALTYFSK